jgi:hypothetical protein
VNANFLSIVLLLTPKSCSMKSAVSKLHNRLNKGEDKDTPKQFFLSLTCVGREEEVGLNLIRDIFMCK